MFEGPNKPSDFAFIEASVIEPILTGVPLSIGRLETELETAGLHPSLIAQPAGSVPLFAVERLLSKLGTVIGDQNVLYHVLDKEEKSDQRKAANVSLPVGMTGFESVVALIEKFDSVFSFHAFSCFIDGNNFWVLRRSNVTEWTDDWCTQQYTLRALLSGVRQLMGKQQLVPTALHIANPPKDLLVPYSLRDVPYIASRSTFGMAFSLEDLVVPPSFLSDRISLAEQEKVHDKPEKLEADLIAYLSLVLGSENTNVDASRVSKALGMSERTYRRKLSELGIGHRRILAKAKLKNAIEMMTDESNTITKIAVDLGYSDSAHFTRFFKSRMGVSPKAFRELNFTK